MGDTFPPLIGFSSFILSPHRHSQGHTILLFPQNDCLIGLITPTKIDTTLVASAQDTPTFPAIPTYLLFALNGYLVLSSTSFSKTRRRLLSCLGSSHHLFPSGARDLLGCLEVGCDGLANRRARLSGRGSPHFFLAGVGQAQWMPCGKEHASVGF
ncbi:hypothetical protein BJV78DRAFT_883019 [Lactifluus subvellereus]|nr:hypothetical protein BJV78DRAFT_883019 [Lactifluus subvellereus]